MSTLTIYTLSLNCGRLPLHPPSLIPHLFSALPPSSPAPTLLILTLQELAPLSPSFLTPSSLSPYLLPFHTAITTASAPLSASYVNILTRNIGMTAIMVFVLRDQTAQVQWMETAGVGVGVWGMGNKGAVGVRLGWAIGDEVVELTFVSVHLAPMEENVERRNRDWRDVVRGLVFTSVSSTEVRRRTTQRLPQESSEEDAEPLLPASGEADGEEDSIPVMRGIYTPTSHLFVAGDFNYRTSSTAPTEKSHLNWPQPTTDPSSRTHYSRLLSSDQLTFERLAGRTCHGLQEAPITFPPTYKYSEKARSEASSTAADGDEVGSWHWSKHRFPSWCDRVLYLDLPPWMKSRDVKSRIQVLGYKALPLMGTSDHRPVICLFSVPAMPIPEPTGEEEEQAKGDVRFIPPVSLDPLWREKRRAARRKEVVVGIAAYLALTWEGRGILIAVVFGAVGGWAVVKALLEV